MMATIEARNGNSSVRRSWLYKVVHHGRMIRSVHRNTPGNSFIAVKRRFQSRIDFNILGFQAHNMYHVHVTYGWLTVDPNMLQCLRYVPPASNVRQYSNYDIIISCRYMCRWA